MLVVLDANVIVKNPLMRGEKWDSASAAIAAGTLRLVVPESARLEAIGIFERTHAQRIRDVKKLLRKSSAGAKSAGAALLAVYEEEAVAYDSRLSARLGAIGVSIARLPSVEHDVMVRRALDRIPPFDETGGGYRDSLLWMSAMEQIDEPPFDSLLLVSDDGVFASQLRTLSEELIDRTGAQLEIARRIEDVDFPGEYDPGSFDLNDSLIEPEQITERIREWLPDVDVSRFVDDFADGARIYATAQVDLNSNSVEVRRRYATGTFEISGEASVVAEVRVFFAWDDDEGEDYAERMETWQFRVVWRVESSDGSEELDGDYFVEVLERVALDENGWG